MSSEVKRQLILFLCRCQHEYLRLIVYRNEGNYFERLESIREDPPLDPKGLVYRRDDFALNDYEERLARIRYATGKASVPDLVRKRVKLWLTTNRPMA